MRRRVLWGTLMASMALLVAAAVAPAWAHAEARHLINMMTTYTAKLGESARTDGETTPSAKLKSAPVARDLTYDRTAQPLVIAGETEAGVLEYALGGDAQTAPTGNWTTTIPTGANNDGYTAAGTYHVWYRCTLDGSASQPECVDVSVKPRPITCVAENVTGSTPLSFDSLAYHFAAATPILPGDSAWTLGVIVSCAAPPDATAGAIYPIRLTGGRRNPNYNPTLVDGTYTVTDLDVRVMSGGYDGIYDGVAHGIGLGTTPSENVTVKFDSDSLTLDNYEANGKDANDESVLFTDAGTYTVYYIVLDNHTQEPVLVAAGSEQVKIAKAPIVPEVTIEGWTIGESPKAPALTGDYSNPGEGEVTFEYKAKEADDSAYSTQPPSEVGNYVVRATVAEADNYQGGTATCSFAITKPELEPTVVIEGWTYGEPANEPTLTEGSNPENGTVTYEYRPKDAEDDAYSSAVPENAGDYYVRATVAETDSFGGGTSGPTEFTIGKAAIYPSVSIEDWTRGEQASTPQLGEGSNPGNGAVTYEYKSTYSGTGAGTSTDFSTTVPVVGGRYYQHTIKATIAETDNYFGGEATCDFFISNPLPTITTAPTAELTYGQTISQAGPRNEDGSLIGGEASVPGKFYLCDDDTMPAVSDSGTEYLAVFVPDNLEGDGYEENECMVAVTVNRAPSVIDLAPAPTNPDWTGDPLELVTAGEAEGGTMQYSLDGETYSDKIPQGIEPKDYIVWYKVAGDENHSDTEAESVTSTITKVPQAISLSGSGHIEDYGDEGAVQKTNGIVIGTTGQSKRLEQFSVSLPEGTDGSIEYRGHVQNKGWDAWVADGESCGTSGESLRLEAVQMRLDGKLSDTHHVWYRTHVQDFGWLGWAKDDQASGTAGQSKRAEAVEIQVLPNGQVPEGYVDGEASYIGAITADVHLQDTGWAGDQSALEFGTTGQSRRLEAISLSVPYQPEAGGISYDVHVQDLGWMPTASDGELAGTTGESRRLEAVRISLTGDALKGNYSVWYRVHSQDYGWLGWAHDGAEAGTTGLSKRAEAIDVQVLPQGQVPIGYDASQAACVSQ